MMLRSLLRALSTPPQDRDTAPDAAALVAHPSAWSRWTQTGPIACSSWGCTHRPPPNATSADALCCTRECKAAPIGDARAARGGVMPTRPP